MKSLARRRRLNTTKKWGVRGVESSNTFAAAALSLLRRVFTFSYRLILTRSDDDDLKVNGSLLKPRFLVFFLSPYSTKTAARQQQSSVCCHVVVKNCKNCRLSYACNSRTFLLFSFDDAGNGKNAPCHLRF